MIIKQEKTGNFKAQQYGRYIPFLSTGKEITYLADPSVYISVNFTGGGPGTASFNEYLKEQQKWFDFAVEEGSYIRIEIR